MLLRRLYRARAWEASSWVRSTTTSSGPAAGGGAGAAGAARRVRPKGSRSCCEDIQRMSHPMAYYAVATVSTTCLFALALFRAFSPAAMIGHEFAPTVLYSFLLLFTWLSMLKLSRTIILINTSMHPTTGAQPPAQAGGPQAQRSPPGDSGRTNTALESCLATLARLVAPTTPVLSLFFLVMIGQVFCPLAMVSAYSRAHAEETRGAVDSYVAAFYSIAAANLSCQGEQCCAVVRRPAKQGGSPQFRPTNCSFQALAHIRFPLHPPIHASLRVLPRGQEGDGHDETAARVPGAPSGSWCCLVALQASSIAAQGLRGQLKRAARPPGGHLPNSQNLAAAQEAGSCILGAPQLVLAVLQLLGGHAHLGANRERPARAQRSSRCEQLHHGHLCEPGPCCQRQLLLLSRLACALERRLRRQRANECGCVALLFMRARLTGAWRAAWAPLGRWAGSRRRPARDCRRQ